MLAMFARLISAPLDFMMLASGAKSFRSNIFIGSERLNRYGLHVCRVTAAARMAAWRRRRLARLVTEEDAASYDRDGFVIRHDVLSTSELAALRSALAARSFMAREMRQGGTVTRFVDITAGLLREVPELDRLARGALFQGLLRYVASTDADPMLYLHTVFATPETGRHDPQTAHHSDTFHATAKSWFFLEDVSSEDGPFTYVPGSHRMTPGRLAWERAQSLTASSHPNGHHALGSFRASRAEIDAMGYGPTISMTVPANTLVVADTHGFHARGRPTRAAIRPAVYGSLRRNPFLPWAGLDPASLPGLRGRKAELWGAWLDFAERRLGRANTQPLTGPVGLTEPPARFTADSASAAGHPQDHAV